MKGHLRKNHFIDLIFEKWKTVSEWEGFTLQKSGKKRRLKERNLINDRLPVCEKSQKALQKEELLRQVVRKKKVEKG